MEVDEGVTALEGGAEGKPVHGLKCEARGGQGAHVPAREHGVVVARAGPSGAHAEPDFFARAGVGPVFTHGHGQRRPVADVVELGISGGRKVEFLAVGHRRVAADGSGGPGPTRIQSVRLAGRV